MDDSKKKMIMLGAVIICLIGAVVMFSKSRSSNVKAIGGSKDVAFKCTAEDCGSEFTMSLSEYNKLTKKQFPGGMPMGGAQVVAECPVCKEKIAIPAIKCTKCGKIFFSNTVEGDYPDICPECGFSRLQEGSGQ